MRFVSEGFYEEGTSLYRVENGEQELDKRAETAPTCLLNKRLDPSWKEVLDGK